MSKTIIIIYEFLPLCMYATLYIIFKDYMNFYCVLLSIRYKIDFIIIYRVIDDEKILSWI